MASAGRTKGYVAYAELLFTLAAIMWFSALRAPVTDVNRTPRIVELILFGVIGVACLAIAVAKGRLRVSETPWLWKASILYCVVAVALLAVPLGGMGIAVLVVWAVCQALVWRATSGR